MTSEEQPPIELEEVDADDKKKVNRTDYDGAWKQILDIYLPEFMEFFFPNVFTQIDWSRGYEVLDQELHKITRGSKRSKRFTDKLVKVWRMDGTAQWVLIHIEIQSQKEEGFEERVFVYFYRLRDVYNIPVATFVVLGDTTEEWKPNSYQEELWGTKLNFEYPTVKLRDYWERWDELEQSKNPFATVVMAHLQTQKSHNNPSTRYDMKLNLVRRLFKLGYQRKDIENLFKFIDWLMWLPDERETEFYQELFVLEEEETTMAYVPIDERIYQISLKQGTTEAEKRMIQHAKEVTQRVNERVVQRAVEMLERIDEAEEILKRADEAKEILRKGDEVEESLRNEAKEILERVDEAEEILRRADEFAVESIGLKAKRAAEEEARRVEMLAAQRAEEIAAQRVVESFLQSKRQMVMHLAARQFKLENESLRKNIEERVNLIGIEQELDDLIDVLFTHPTLTVFMTHLPELATEMTPAEILDFWFGKLDEQGETTLEDKSALWWGKSEETDALITSKIGPLVEPVATGQRDVWLATPDGRMAAIIVLDQCTRNIFRGTAQAFAYDQKAREFCLQGLELGVDQELPLIQRVFFYLPLEHAEDRELQVRSTQMYEQLLADVSESVKDRYANYLDFAVRHKAIIDRFGHYPHRNEILGRTSTPEEIAFLEEPGSSFL